MKIKKNKEELHTDSHGLLKVGWLSTRDIADFAIIAVIQRKAESLSFMKLV